MQKNKIKKLVKKAPAKKPAPRVKTITKTKPPAKAKTKTKTPPPPTLSQVEKRQLRAEMEWKEERVLMARIKRRKIEGDLITKEAAGESAVFIIQDLRAEIMRAIEGIAQTKTAAVNKIFKKYLN